MKKSAAVFACFFLLLFPVFCISASARDKPDAEDIKRMSTFLSNFTEATFFEITDVNSLTRDELVFFGIQHNYINNFKSRIKKCPVKNCEHGPFVIEEKWVKESLKKYFDIDFKDITGQDDPDSMMYYDGKLYHFREAEGGIVYYVQVQSFFEEGGLLQVKGHLYNSEDKQDIPALLRAVVKPHTFGGKKTWALLSLETLWN
jgi:hypothetical protein